jgi:cytochrome b6
LKRHLEDFTWEAVRTAAASWLRQRVDWEPAVELAAKKTVPIHRFSWLYLLGGAAMMLFVLQAATGCLLMLYYQPAQDTAHQSVEQIMTQVPYGWLIRSMHAWGASLFIAVAGLHFLSVLLTKAYRKPRELTWLSGLLMFVLAVGFGFSGYLLPWNERAFFATQVGTDIPDVVPLVGGFIVHFLRGGQQVTGATLTRFFGFHVAFLPVIFGALLAIHLLLIQVQGMSLPLGMSPRSVRDQRPFFSEFMLIDFSIGLLLLGAIVTLSVFLPEEVGRKADLLKPAPVGIRPEWYFLFMFKTLKLVPEALGVGMFALGGLFFLLLPFLDRNAGRERKSPRFTAVFVMVLLCAAVLEGLALLDPALENEPETLVAETYSLAGGAVSLVLLWAAIAFLIYYLRQLLGENTRLRKWRRPDENP